MKVALIVPTFKYKTQYPAALSLSDFPTGFGYLAASLKQAGHEVIGINPNNITGYPSARIMLHSVLSQRLTESKPDLIATGGLATDYLFLEDCIKICRTVCPDVPIVLGGQIVTNDAEDVFKLLKPDYAISGEGERALDYLCEAYTHRNFPQPKILDVKNYDLDSLPFPDYEPFGVQDMMNNHSEDTRILYRYSRAYPRPWVLVASRSCPFDCSFCVHHHRDIPYRARSIPNIMAEIKETYAKYKFNILMIDDELFAVNKQRLNDFSNAVMAYKAESGADFDWMFQTHASAKLDLDTLKLARQAGCYLFSYGLESASPAVLKSMNKKIEVSQVVEAINLAEEANIGFSANLIFGDIAETQDTWAESMAFWLEHGRKSFIFMTNLMPYPGSKLFETMRAAGAFPDKKHFYEHIDEGAVNMTTIKPQTFVALLKQTIEIEKGWIFSAEALDVRAEVESGDGEWQMWKIRAKCPYCGHDSEYRQKFNTGINNFSLGTGCVYCNRKIRVDKG